MMQNGGGGGQSHNIASTGASSTEASSVTPESTATSGGNHRHALQKMTRTVAHYKRLEQIGLGTYGQVYRAECLDTGRTVAMKKMRVSAATTARSWNTMGMPLQLIREIKILKQLQHPNLLQMIEVVTSKGVEHLDPEDPIVPSNAAPADIDPSSKKKRDKYESLNPEEDAVLLARERFKGNLFLVLEYVTHDLTGLMDIQYQFTPVQIKCIFQQLLKALQFMHEHKYVHRDIKSSNILLDSHFRLKLADFGLARSLEPPLLDQLEEDGVKSSSAASSGSGGQDLTNKVITLWYRPPEVLLGTVNYGCAVDVWSAGCILIELLAGKPLAAGKSELNQLKLLADIVGTPDEETWSYLVSLKKSKSLDEQIPPFAATLRDDERKSSKLRLKFGPQSKNPARQHISETALNLLDKLLEWDPRKRLTASFALQNRYFWTQPVPPEDPAELGRIEVVADCHEHITKQKRKAAKVEADVAREQAVLQGASQDEAESVFDATYKGIMKRVAQEGLDVALSQASTTADLTEAPPTVEEAATVEAIAAPAGEVAEDAVMSEAAPEVSEPSELAREASQIDKYTSTAPPREGDDHGAKQKSDDNRQSSSRNKEELGAIDEYRSRTGRDDRDRSRMDPDKERWRDGNEEFVPDAAVRETDRYAEEGGDNRRTRDDHQRRRERHGDKGDVHDDDGNASYRSGDKRRHKEKRKRSSDDSRERRERRHRKESGDDDFKDSERHADSPRVDESVTSSRERRSSGKRSRRDSGGSSGKKERDRSRGHRDRKSSEKRDKERRHKDKKRSRRDHDRERGGGGGGSGDNLDSYRRPEDSMDRRDRPGDRGPTPMRGDESMSRYGPSGGRSEPSDDPSRRGHNFGRDTIPGEGRDVRPTPDRRDRDGPPPPADYYGPPRDGPGPGFRRGDREPGPRDRDGPLHRNDFPSGPRNERDGPRMGDPYGPPRHREHGRDGPTQPAFRGDMGPPGGPRFDRDGPRDRDGRDHGPGGGGSGGYHPRQDYPRDGPRDGPMHPTHGPDHGRRGGMPPPRMHHDDAMRDGPHGRPRTDGRRDRDRGRDRRP